MIEYDFPDGRPSINRNMYAYTIFGLRNRRKTLYAELCRNERKEYLQSNHVHMQERKYAQKPVVFFYAFLTTDWLKKVARVFLTNHKLYELNLTESKPEFEMNLGPSTDNCSAYFLLVYLLDLFSLFKDKTTQTESLSKEPSSLMSLLQLAGNGNRITHGDNLEKGPTTIQHSKETLKFLWSFMII